MGQAPRINFESWGIGLPDALRFPFRRFSIESQLPIQDTVARLRGIIEQRNLMLAEFFPSEKLFAGEFSGDHFKLERIPPLIQRAGARAIIEGRFEPAASGSRVLITMRLRRRDQVGVFIWFTIGGLLLLVCVFGPLVNPRIHGSASFAMFMLLLLAGGYAIAAASFNLEVRRTRELLLEALQPNPSERVREALSDAAARRIPRFKRSLRTFVIAMAIIFAGAMIYPALFARTDQFRIARDYLEADSHLRSEIGTITAVETDRRAGYRSTSVGSEEQSNFAVRVTGTRGIAVVTVTMRKHLGTWEVSSARLRKPDGGTIALDAPD